ncbi:carbohydrate ABC transporter permease [Pseudonocardia sichuanensis]|uniref:Carbohydrate ABC transporter membrane protein 1 (CUT1 family) n=1 Tax=Pseudonocardia kunmingensis TaxID=630975 RepID=A0A543DQQ7_9PSEU|nr:sugar ABC transporter permease [Pseudonocardia kunmingensis]TQM11648.1 carbohydrate ABC transporter membrane protein 1 (CUT1 family) [Pseudonocardia kunmingensis]
MTKPVDERHRRAPLVEEQVPPPPKEKPPWPSRLPPLVNWPVIFAIPFVLTALLVVVYPVVYGFWMGADPDLYEDLFTDDMYLRTVVNTIIFVGFGVNLKLVLALLLSGFFAVGTWWIRGLLAVSLLPWAIPSVPALLSIHWMLNPQWGMLGTLLGSVGIANPDWLIDSTWGMTAAIGAHIWKWLPFWTLIMLAARMAIPQDVYEAAAVDGATGLRRFYWVTFPMLSNVFLTSALLSSIWTLSDYNSIHFITGGGPADTTHVLATLGIRFAFDVGDVDQGIAVALTALPVIIPLIIVLVRRLGREGF